MAKEHLMNGKEVRRSNVRIRNALRIFKWEIQTWMTFIAWQRGEEVKAVNLLRWNGREKAKLKLGLGIVWPDKF